MKTVMDNMKFKLSLAMLTASLSACSGSGGGIPPQQVADSLFAVMEADRTVYTRYIVNRLQNQERVIKASEHWKDDKALVLPAQMFRLSAERVAEKDVKFSYSLQSLWPVNKKNKPRTEVEKVGLQYLVDNPGKNYYAEEKLGGKRYFTAVYADVAVAKACITCHNKHKDSPRNNFKMGEIMGGVVIRLALD